jgi:hypothetical protein
MGDVAILQACLPVRRRPVEQALGEDFRRGRLRVAPDPDVVGGELRVLGQVGAVQQPDQPQPETLGGGEVMVLAGPTAVGETKLCACG